MLTKMRLENFKSWRELDIDLAPITLLYGTNSSGKSSILQSLLLLMQTGEKGGGNKVDFGGNPNDYVNLGSYRETVFNHDIEKDIVIGLQFGDRFRYYGSTVKIFQQKDEVIIEEDSPGWLDFFVENSYGEYLNYLGPLRSKAERSYLWSGSTPYRINTNGENAIAALISSERTDDDLHLGVSRWLAGLGLLEDFHISPLDSGKRFYEPLGKVINIESSLLDVGFGVSQVLPVVTLLFFVPENSIVLIEQPELHLHPSAQAKLADLFLEVAEKRGLQLIIESHSEHLLRRMQRRIAEVDQPFANPDNIKAYFCEATAEGSKIQAVEVDDYGQIRNWPENFFGDLAGDLDAMMQAGIERRRKELSSGD